MLSVLIAEDEMLVRMGLVVSMDWEKHDMQVVAEASNGNSALEAFRKYQPDIVMTDIRMPGMDGLTLIQQIRQIDEECAIIIITCMTDFQTLHEAMRYNISSYLIKATMTLQNITDALQKACHDLRRAQRVERQDSLRENERLLHDALYSYLFARETTYQHLQQTLARHHLPEPKPPSVMAAYVQHGKDAENIMLQSICRMIERSFRPGGRCMSFLGERAVVVLMEPDESYDAQAGAAALSEVKEYIKENFALSLRFVYCNEPVPVRDLPSLLDAAQELQTHRYLFDVPLLNVDARGAIAERDILEWIETLKGYAINLRCNPSQYDDYLSSMDTLRNVLGQSRAEILRRFYELTVLLVQGNRKVSSTDLAACHECLADATSLRSMMSLVDRQILALVQPATTSYTHLLASAVEYMSTHLTENLALSDLAGYVNLSPGYFSTLLKQETGMRYSEFLGDMRIKKAQELLKNPLLSVNDIAMQCGFVDIAYFSRCFKKKVGVPPSQWRKV